MEWIAFFLAFVIAPFLFVYGLYKIAGKGGGYFAGSFVSMYYAWWIFAVYAEMNGML